MDTEITYRDFSPAQVRLIRAAEKLIAEKGLDAVSDREIARAAGQKNNSAVQYHFEDRPSLIQAVLDYRMLPLNALRHQMLDELEATGQQGDLRALLSAFVLPYVRHLQELPEESYYVSLLSQLYSRNAESVFLANSGRTSSLVRITELLVQASKDFLSQEDLYFRLSLTGRLLIHTVATWDIQRRQNPELWTADEIHRQAGALIDYVVGAFNNKPESKAGAEDIS